jgi:hypothetical protein
VAWDYGWYYLGPGWTTDQDISWGGKYPGLQYVMARPWSPSTGVQYRVDTETQGFAQTNGNWVYHVRARNAGPSGTYYSWTGWQVDL